MKKRGVRSGRKVIALQDRDIMALSLIGLTTYCDASQVQRDLFGTANRLRRRARDWLDADLIRVHVGDSRAPSILSLSARGVAVVKEHLGQDAPVRTAGYINLAGSAHHLACVDVRIAAAELARTSGLNFWWHGGRSDMATALGLAAASLVPDGISDYENPTTGAQWCVGIESDLSTEDGPTVMRKLRKWSDYLADRPEFQLWIVGLDGEHAQERLISLARGVGMGPRCVVMGLAAMRARPLQIAWQAAAQRRHEVAFYNASGGSRNLHASSPIIVEAAGVDGRIVRRVEGPLGSDRPRGPG